MVRVVVVVRGHYARTSCSSLITVTRHDHVDHGECRPDHTEQVTYWRPGEPKKHAVILVSESIEGKHTMFDCYCMEQQRLKQSARRLRADQRRDLHPPLARVLALPDPRSVALPDRDARALPRRRQRPRPLVPPLATSTLQVSQVRQSPARHERDYGVGRALAGKGRRRMGRSRRRTS